MRILDNGKKALELSKETHTPAKLFGEKWRMREVSRAADTLRSHAHKCAGLLEFEEAAEISESLCVQAEYILQVHKFFDTCRRTPNDLLNGSDYNALFGNVVRRLPKALLQNVMTMVGTMLTGRLNRPRDLMHVLTFCRNQDTQNAFHVGLLKDETVAFSTVQTQIVLAIAERLFKLTVDQFLDFMQLASDENALFNDHDNYFASTNNSTPGTELDNGKVFCRQAWVDLSLLKVLFGLMSWNKQKEESTDFKMPRPKFVSMVQRTVAQKADVSVRLRTFTGAKIADGNGDVGRRGWALALEVCKSCANESAALKKAKTLWSELSIAKLPDSAQDTMDQFADWYNTGVADKLLELAKMMQALDLGALAEGTDSEASADEFMQHTRRQMVAALDHVASSGNFIAWLEKMLGAGEDGLEVVAEAEDEQSKKMDAWLLFVEAITFTNLIDSCIDPQRAGDDSWQETLKRVQLITAAIENVPNDEKQWGRLMCFANGVSSPSNKRLWRKRLPAGRSVPPGLTAS